MTSTHEAAADILRRWALDEALKARVLENPVLAAEALKIAGRYIAGESIASAIAAVRRGLHRGHLGSIEYVGESIRHADLASSETETFVELAETIARERLPSTISLDLSHVGAVVDSTLALENARRLAEVTAGHGIGLMISAEGSDRTEIVLDLYDSLAADHAHVGITLQARLHRTAADVERVLARAGRIRLVKGAFRESETVAYRRDSDELTDAYVGLARRIIDCDHPVTIATHDTALIDLLVEEHGERLRRPFVEFEMLLGLGTNTLDALHGQGFRTREYVIFGHEWWLYVLNRLAEHPDRVIVALSDLAQRRD